MAVRAWCRDTTPLLFYVRSKPLIAAADGLLIFREGSTGRRGVAAGMAGKRALSRPMASGFADHHGADLVGWLKLAILSRRSSRTLPPSSTTRYSTFLRDKNLFALAYSCSPSFGQRQLPGDAGRQARRLSHLIAARVDKYHSLRYVINRSPISLLLHKRPFPD